MDTQDGIYDRTKPWNSNDERIVSERLAEAAHGGPAAAQDGWRKQPLFPERFGYEKREIGVHDCFDIEQQFGNARNDYSRVTSGYSGSTTTSMPVA